MYTLWVEAEKLRVVSSSVLRLGLKTLKPVVSEDAVIDSRFKGDSHFADMQRCSLLSLHILVRGRVSAFLTLENRLLRSAFRAERVETISMLCGQLAISIENVRLYESLERKVAERTSALKATNQKLEEANCKLEDANSQLENANCKLEALSSTDGLTGIANRRRFDDVLLNEWRRAVRSAKPLALALLDDDLFKKYNDHYGHQAGDECLKLVAQALDGSVKRSGELAARYGGEEFVAFLPGLCGAEACEVAERIRAAVQAQAIPHALGTEVLVITVSIGVASCIPMIEQNSCEDKNSPTALLQKADHALYQAKNDGRHRVVLADRLDIVFDLEL